MKSLFEAIAIAALITAPLAAFAQSTNQPLTRAEVRADLVRVEQAGFDPTDRLHYPQNIQAAEARIAAQNAAHDSGVGASTNGSSQSGQ
ncbi:DUF4148 domain-containing protein [Paraburkholderia sp.]|uniref:DUF4148 domain-containing protein n=1 Tax=Paraburkholderia sp. TaxID=1926495 RepID=UPI003D6EB31D